MVVVVVGADEVDQVVAGVVAGLDVDYLGVARLALRVEYPVVDAVDHLVHGDVLIESAAAAVGAGAVGAAVVAVGVGQLGKAVLGGLVVLPVGVDLVDLVLGALTLLVAYLSVLIGVVDLDEYVAEAHAVVGAVVVAGVEDHDVVAGVGALNDGHVPGLAGAVKHPLGEVVGEVAADAEAEGVLVLGDLGVLDLAGDGLGEVRAALDGGGDAVGDLLGVGHGGLGHPVVGLLGLLAGLLVGHGLGDLLGLGADEVVVKAQRVEGVGVLVVVAVELVGGVLKALEHVGGVALGDVGALEQLAHERGVHALAVGQGDVAVGAAQVVLLGQSGIVGDDVVDGGAVLLAERVAGLSGGVPDGGDLHHILQRGLAEVVRPGDLLGGVVAGEGVGQGQTEHLDHGRVHRLILQVGVRVKAEVAGDTAVLGDKVVVRSVVVVLVLGVSELVVAYGHGGGAGVEQVGVQHYDEYDEHSDDDADYRPRPPLLFVFELGLALGERLRAGACGSLGLAPLLVLRCAHYAFILFIRNCILTCGAAPAHVQPWYYNAYAGAFQGQIVNYSFSPRPKRRRGTLSCISTCNVLKCLVLFRLGGHSYVR